MLSTWMNATYAKFLIGFEDKGENFQIRSDGTFRLRAAGGRMVRELSIVADRQLRADGSFRLRTDGDRMFRR
jgi:hypothetical protein